MNIPLNAFHDGYIAYEAFRLIVTFSVVWGCFWTLKLSRNPLAGREK